MSQDSSILKAQSLIEINEDIMSSILENMQLGRLEDGMKLYSLLYNNLVSMATELDNYPYGDVDPYSTISKYPDELMRRDILDTLLPSNASTNVPLPNKAPLPPPCQKCASQKFNSQKCRVELGHVDLSSKFDVTEKEEFVRATQVLELRYREYNRQQDKNKFLQKIINSRGTSGYNSVMGPSSNSILDSKLLQTLNESNSNRRLYKRWSDAERHLICIGILLYGPSKNTAITQLFPDRNASQVSYHTYICDKYLYLLIRLIYVISFDVCVYNYAFHLLILILIGEELYIQEYIHGTDHRHPVWKYTLRPARLQIQSQAESISPSKIE